MSASHTSQSMLTKGKRLMFNAINKPASHDDEQTLVFDDKDVTPENSTNDVNRAPAAEQERKLSHEKRSPSRFKDALNDYVTYRHSLSSAEQGTRNISTSGGSGVSRTLQMGNVDVDIRVPRDTSTNNDHQDTTEKEPIYVVRILRSYSSREHQQQQHQQQQQQQDIVENCCQDFNNLQLINSSIIGSELVASNTTGTDSSSVVTHSTLNTEQNFPLEKPDACRTTSPQEVTPEKPEPTPIGKKQKRSVRKLLRLSPKSGRGSKRKRASTKGVRFEILRESMVEGEGGNVADGGQGKSKRKRKAAKRMAKTAGKRLWKGFRVGCKFLWEGLIIYAKPFGTMDFTRAWEDKNTYSNNNNNSNNNNDRTFTNYNTARNRETVI